ncbi:MAG: hypothetical protein AAF389_14950 [Gemmatimonadota bacterium]
MGRALAWTMSPGETLSLGVSLATDLEDGDTLTGTPTVTLWQLDSGTWVEKTAQATIANQQVNASELTDANGDPIPVGKGAMFRLTAPTTEGVYDVKVSCPSTDGEGPATSRKLYVVGP